MPAIREEQDIVFSRARRPPRRPLPPPPLAAPEASSLESFLRLARNVDPGSNAGLPGLSLPAGLSDDGLPIGLEVDGLPGEDRKILAVGVALEPLLGRLAPPPA